MLFNRPPNLTTGLPFTAGIWSFIAGWNYMHSRSLVLELYVLLLTCNVASVWYISL